MHVLNPFWLSDSTQIAPPSPRVGPLIEWPNEAKTVMSFPPLKGSANWICSQANSPGLAVVTLTFPALKLAAVNAEKKKSIKTYCCSYRANVLWRKMTRIFYVKVISAFASAPPSNHSELFYKPKSPKIDSKRKFVFKNRKGAIKKAKRDFKYILRRLFMFQFPCALHPPIHCGSTSWRSKRNCSKR